jgi:hypothetical protein
VAEELEFIRGACSLTVDEYVMVKESGVVDPERIKKYTSVVWVPTDGRMFPVTKEELVARLQEEANKAQKEEK